MLALNYLLKWTLYSSVVSTPLLPLKQFLSSFLGVMNPDESSFNLLGVLNFSFFFMLLKFKNSSKFKLLVAEVPNDYLVIPKDFYEACLFVFGSAGLEPDLVPSAFLFGVLVKILVAPNANIP